jgi:hypothetical protein
MESARIVQQDEHRMHSTQLFAIPAVQLGNFPMDLSFGVRNVLLENTLIHSDNLNATHVLSESLLMFKEAVIAILAPIRLTQHLLAHIKLDNV